MIGLLMRLFGKRMVHNAVAQHAGGFLDAKLGFALLRDKRVPLQAKLMAFGIAAAAIAALFALELPLEGVLDFFMPFLLLPEALVDGFELLIGPVLFACLALPHLAPKPVVQALRDERDGNVLDVEFETTPRTQNMRMNVAG